MALRRCPLGHAARCAGKMNGSVCFTLLIALLGPGWAVLAQVKKCQLQLSHENKEFVDGR